MGYPNPELPVFETSFNRAGHGSFPCTATDKAIAGFYQRQLDQSLDMIGLYMPHALDFEIPALVFGNAVEPGAA
ncbi:hypothetical protein DFR30_2387 [Thiogranum longum]|uniref:Uncharacterized protein n=1 Tax=Thiogranum longum TaxID=1537524 RepID=A0A4R1HEL5_9GAMM|nr:hypothetical protein DFR30_2387 [Thiogranum longum]